MTRIMGNVFMLPSQDYHVFVISNNAPVVTSEHHTQVSQQAKTYETNGPLANQMSRKIRCFIAGYDPNLLSLPILCEYQDILYQKSTSIHPE